LPRTPKDVTLTPLTTEGNSVIDVSDCHQDDNGGIVDDKMLFAGLTVSELTSVENVEDGITSNSMSTLFSEQKIDSETTNSDVSITSRSINKIIRVFYYFHCINILESRIHTYCNQTFYRKDHVICR
jgi:hypothetical protein